MNHKDLYTTLRAINGGEEKNIDIVLTNYYETRMITNVQAQGGNIFVRDDDGELHQIEKNDTSLIELIYNAIEQQLKEAV